MDYKYKAESGLQLLARLSARPCLRHLDDMLFPEGPNPGEVIEISGETNVGKSMLLLKLIAKCLLPKSYEDVEIGGLNAGVILIDTDHNMSVLKLFSIMEKCIVKSQLKKRVKTKETVRFADVVENIIKDSLNKLIILKTYSSEQLLMNFYSLGALLTANLDVTLLVIDSITSYYWQESLNLKNVRKMEIYLKRMIKKLQSCIKEYKITTIFVKQEYFQSKLGKTKPSSESGSGLIDYKIELKKSGNQGEELCKACGYGSKYEELHNFIKQSYPDTEFKTLNGPPGSFEIKINNTLAYSKLLTLAFPDFQNVAEVVGSAAKGEPVRRIVKQQPITDCSIM